MSFRSIFPPSKFYHEDALRRLNVLQMACSQCRQEEYIRGEISKVRRVLNNPRLSSEKLAVQLKIIRLLEKECFLTRNI